MSEIRFNHSPFVFGVWVEFNGQRFKDKYAIELHDGTLFKIASPNGGGWHVDGGRIVEDAEVKRVMLLPDGLVGRFQMEGRMRLARNLSYFGTRYPMFIDGKFIHEDELPEGQMFSPIGLIAFRGSHSKEIRIVQCAAEIVPKVVEETSLIQYMTEAANKASDFFWTDEEVQIMTGIEVINASRRVLELAGANPDQLKEIINFCETSGMERNVYIPMLPGMVKEFFGPNGDNLKTQIKMLGSYKGTIPRHFNDYNKLGSTDIVIGKDHTKLGV